MNKEEIYNLVYEILGNWELDEREIISVYKKELIDNVKVLNGYKERMDEIENLIHNHAIGVQNVYNKFKEIEDTIKSEDFKETFRHLQNLNDKYALDNLNEKIRILIRISEDQEILKAINTIEEIKQRLEKAFSF